ncbi:MAG: hypothetical protein J2P31_02400 [Blastocatellia bacterium]|nr:hypothetical protein [Blastocatellia bacterium]
MFTGVRQDLRFALRMMRKNPGFTAVAVITLALGIGANTAIFTLMDAVVLKRLPVNRPDQLIELMTVYDARSIASRNAYNSFSYPALEYLRRHNRSLSRPDGSSAAGVSLFWGRKQKGQKGAKGQKVELTLEAEAEKYFALFAIFALFVSSPHNHE